MVGKDHVAGLLAAEVEAAVAHFLQHVAVAHAGFAQADAGIAQGDLQAEVAHHRGHQDVVLELPGGLEGHGEDGHDLVAVHLVAFVVHGQAAVGVAVVGDAEVGAVRPRRRS